MKSIDFAIIEVESQGNDLAHGDIGFRNPQTDALEEAFGPLQIRQPVCDDVNHRYGTHFKAEDMLGHRSLSLAVFWLYMSIYATSNMLGRTVTDEDRARCWNGGPSAWKQGTPLYVATTPYWERVQAAMNS